MSHVRSLNRVILIGRVGRDPEITHIPSIERDVAKFSLATNEGYMDKNNQWKDITEWHNIVAWGPLAQKTERSVHKGAMVLVEGKIKSRKWQDQSGNSRRSTEIEVENLVLLERVDKGSSYPDSGGQSAYGGSGRQDAQSPMEDQFPPVQDIKDFPYDNNGEGDPF